MRSGSNLKGGPASGLASLHAITAGPSDCAGIIDGETITAAASPRYLSVVQRTGGLHRSICAEDWGAIASDLAGSVSSPRRAFQLTAEPDPSTLAVTVDGFPSTRGLQFDLEGATLVFRTGSVPSPGATIRAEYLPRCH